MPSTETSHFFLGRFRSAQQFGEFLKEDYSKDDDDTPLSPFYGSQGETFCDHDFMEHGFRDKEPTLKEFFAPYSYAEHWAEELAKRAADAGLDDANALIFITDSEIANPRSVSGDGFTLTYLGKIKYSIDE
jgi:Immunity protein 22